MNFFSMNLKDTYEYGRGNGLGIGECNRMDYNDFDSYFSDCLETESDHFRQYSPFEFYAKEFNEKPDPDRYWEEYEKGVAVGIRKAWREK